MLKRLLPLLKAAWLILVIITVCAYIFRNVDTIVTLLREIPIERLLMSVSLALIGRLLIAQLARVATSNIGWLPSYRDMLYMMGTSELGKYLPGGVWHFLGRAAYYRSANLPATDLTQALIFENLSLVLSALLAGSCFLISYAHIPLMNKLLLISVVILIWFCILWIMLRQQENLKSLPILKLFLLQWAIWLAFSLSFIFVLPDIAYQDNLFLALGAFPIGWLLGFLTPFAPGGVGTREIVLIALLLPSFGSETTLVFVAFHRLLWVILELLLGLLVIIWGRDAT